jgi:hypothetical protein
VVSWRADRLPNGWWGDTFSSENALDATELLDATLSGKGIPKIETQAKTAVLKRKRLETPAKWGLFYFLLLAWATSAAQV